MAAQRKAKKSSGGRGSKEAIEKRRAARQLNSVLTGGAKHGDRLDGRTEKRRQRLIEELKEGRSGKALKPIEFVTHINELLDLGETLPSLRKQGVKPRRTEQTEDVMEVIRWTQQAYEFHPEVWRMLGIPPEDAQAGGGRKAKSTGRKNAAGGKPRRKAKTAKRRKKKTQRSRTG